MQNKIKTFEGIDYNFRPKDYFSELNDLEQLLLKNIKGEFRRREIKKAIKDGTYDHLPDMIRQAKLSDKARDLIGQLHPVFMGGEYLPDYNPFETEIARIILDSVTLDVISIRAWPEEGMIYYRIVDEYGDLNAELPFESSTLPLSLLELIEFLSNTYVPGAEHYLPWAFTRCNIDCLNHTDDPLKYKDFTSIDSEYYFELSDHYYREIDEQFPSWLEFWKSSHKVSR